MNLTLTVVLSLAGLIAIFAALLGNIVWVDGKPRGEIRSSRIRWALGFLGIVLISSSFFLAVRLAPAPKCVGCEELAQRVNDFEITQESFQDLLTSIEGDIVQLRNQDEKNAHLTREILGKVSCIRDKKPLGECAQRYREGKYDFSKGPDDVNVRDFSIALWEVEVVVPLGENKKEALERKIGELNIGVFVRPLGDENVGERDPGPARHKKFRGIVVDENIPREVVCKVKGIFEKKTNIKISTITSAARFRERQGSADNFHRIQVGVPFDLHFQPDSIDTEIDWKSLCSDDYDQVSYVQLIESLGEKLQKVKTNSREKL